jgi:hypothetical protein
MYKYVSPALCLVSFNSVGTLTGSSLRGEVSLALNLLRLPPHRVTRQDAEDNEACQCDGIAQPFISLILALSSEERSADKHDNDEQPDEEGVEDYGREVLNENKGGKKSDAFMEYDG